MTNISPARAIAGGRPLPMASRRNGSEPCPCGSKLLYESCHQSIVEASPEDMLDVAHRHYAKAWAGNAAHYKAMGLYRQLAAILFDACAPARIIDVGCGLGDGIYALRDVMGERGASIIGIDENPECLAVAAHRLCLDEPMPRMGRTRRTGRCYDQYYIAGNLQFVDASCLIHSDVLRLDVELDQALVLVRKFDAMTLWFTGTHKAREHDVLIQQLHLHSDELHDIAVEIATFRLATERLRSGGILQIVSRGADADLAKVGAAFRYKMEAMVLDRPFALIDLQVIPYAEPSVGHRIGVGSLSFDARHVSKGVVSMIFRRH